MCDEMTPAVIECLMAGLDAEPEDRLRSALVAIRELHFYCTHCGRHDHEDNWEGRSDDPEADMAICPQCGAQDDDILTEPYEIAAFVLAKEKKP